MSFKAMRVGLLALVFAVIAVLNAIPNTGMFPFEEQAAPRSGFGLSRGWPLGAVAPANYSGLMLVRSSLVQGEAVVYERVFEGRHRHLAVNWLTVVIDLLIAGVILALTWFLPVLLVNKPSP